MVVRPKPILALAATLFFLSGALGLGYELVWVKKAALIVGASQIALATVLTAFFLGLGLGSLFVGRYVEARSRSPLFIYGLFEIAIGIYALCFPILFELAEACYGGLYGLVAASPPGLFALRFGLLFMLFLPPTFFMGGTLPLLLDGLVERDQAIGSRTSFLYGLNILGAVCGVLATSYWAIPALGMDGTSRAGGIANLAIGAVAVLAFRRVAPIHAPPGGAVRSDRSFAILAFASGLLAIGYQIAWARYFSLFNTGTVYLTAVLLAVYLLALAAGSLILTPLLAMRLPPLGLLGVAQAVAPALVLLGIEGWRLAEYRFALRGEQLPSGELVAMATLEIDPVYLAGGRRLHWQLLGETVDATFTAPFLQVAFSIFVPVALLGMGLPCLIAAAAGDPARLKSVSGRLVFWSTLGSSLGGFLTGYALLPVAGLHWTLVLLGLGSLGLAIAASWKRAAAAGRPRPRPFELALPLLALACVVGFAFGREDLTRATIKYHGYGRDPEVGYDPDRPAAPRAGKLELEEVVEGPLTTAFLFENARSARIGSGNVCLAVAYKSGFSTQALQGHIPCLFYPGEGSPRNCLGICLGSGQSFGALLLYSIETLDVVDISREIVDLSLRRFAPYNHQLGTDPRVRFHLDDGRHFIDRARDAAYDVISMEPPPPTAEGVYSLYSLELYTEAARVLRPDGVFMQWLPLYRITPLDAQGIIQTQARVFPETFVVKVGLDDFMVVSYKQRPVFRLDRLRARLAKLEEERFAKELRWSPGCRHDLVSLEGVLALLLMGPVSIPEMGPPIVYHDDDQRLSYSSGDRWLLRRYEGPALSTLSFGALRLTGFDRLQGYFEPPLSAPLIADLNRERAASLARFNVPDPQRIAELEAVPAGAGPGERAQRALQLASLDDAMHQKGEAFRHLETALEALAGLSFTPDEKVKVAVRAIVRNGIAAHEELVARRLDELETRFPGSPLLAEMRHELKGFQARDGERRRRYWLP